MVNRVGLLAVLVLTGGPLFAHPHVFIDNRMTVLFDGATLKGIALTWTFDEMFSSMMLTDFPAQADGSFSAKTATALKAGGFDNLANYHYFVELSIGGKPVTKLRIEGFTPRVIKGGTLVYSFFVALDLPVTAAEQVVRATVYDDSYYVAFDLLHVENVTVEGASAVSCRLSVEKTTVKASWPGQYMPDQLVIRVKK